MRLRQSTGVLLVASGLALAASWGLDRVESAATLRPAVSQVPGDDEDSDCSASGPDLPPVPSRATADLVRNWRAMGVRGGVVESIPIEDEAPEVDVRVRVLFVYLGLEDAGFERRCKEALGQAQKVFSRTFEHPSGTKGPVVLEFAGAVESEVPGEPVLKRFADIGTLDELLHRAACDCDSDAGFVADLRAQHSADLVCLVAREQQFSQSSGTAFVYEPRDDAWRRGFCAVSRLAIERSYEGTLAHELGHLFGCLHQPEVMACSSPFGAHPMVDLDFGAGQSGYGTLMRTSRSRRLMAFSSPKLHARYSGAPGQRFEYSHVAANGWLQLGVDSDGCVGHDNASIILANAPAVAAYMP